MTIRELWPYLQKTEKPIYLYGMGNGADTILDKLQSLGVQAAGVFASDTFVRHQNFRGYTVCSYAEAKARHPQMIVLIAFGSSLTEVMDNMRRIAAEQETYAPALPLFGGDFFTLAYAKANQDALRQTYALLADEISRRTFCDLIRYKISGDFSYLTDCETPQQEAFDLLDLQPGSSYADLGAYNGDTIAQFVQLCPLYDRIYAMEPDRKTFRKLIANTASLPRTTLWNTCSGAESAFVSFSTKGGRNSAVGTGNTIAQWTLDDLTQGAPIHYLKLDVEGQEANALLGAQQTIQQYKPRMLVSAYHRSEDLFRLPLLIHQMRPDYRIYLRHHPYIPEWDTNFYFI